MSRRTIAGLALLCLAFAPSSAKANLIVTLPNDFTALRGWDLQRCETHGFFPGTNFVTLCAKGQVVFGRNTITNAFGVVYDFFTTQQGTVPTGSSFIGGVSGFGLTTAAHLPFTFAQIGNIDPPGFGFLTSGVAYLPSLYEGSDLAVTLAKFRADECGPPCGSVGADERFGAMTVSVVSLPEPSTIVLLASGLAAMLPFARQRRRQQFT